MMPHTGLPVYFHFMSAGFSLEDRRMLKHFLVQLFHTGSIPLGSLSYIFCTDEYLLAINRKFLAHNEYTDVVTFTLNEKYEPLVGEIYISIERVRENAYTFKTTFKEELHRVIFHGALHLCGYTDKKPRHLIKMRQKEDECLRQYTIFKSKSLNSK